jgi:hypothetical protein
VTIAWVADGRNAIRSLAGRARLRAVVAIGSKQNRLGWPGADRFGPHHELVEVDRRAVDCDESLMGLRSNPTLDGRQRPVFPGPGGDGSRSRCRSPAERR